MQTRVQPPVGEQYDAMVALGGREDARAAPRGAVGRDGGVGAPIALRKHAGPEPQLLIEEKLVSDLAPPVHMAQRTTAIRIALPTTERLFWHGGAHTAKSQSA